MMDTKVLTNLIADMLSESEKAAKDMKAAGRILELNKKFKEEIEK